MHQMPCLNERKQVLEITFQYAVSTKYDAFTELLGMEYVNFNLFLIRLENYLYDIFVSSTAVMKYMYIPNTRTKTEGWEI